MPKNILIGVSGGISAYKTCELVREFQKKNADLKVIMTRAAQEFVTPLTFESLTRNKVYTDLFRDDSFGTAHIDVARWADAFVIAPATANTIAKCAGGKADDFLSTVYLAYRGDVFVAPAMNTAMWEHPSTQENVATLKRRKVHVIEPTDGQLACGEEGAGRMAEPKDICRAVLGGKSLEDHLKRKKVVVTAGPTREYIDPVRFISSPSTGTMGIEIAREASRRGASVTLIHGPLATVPKVNAHVISVESSKEMNNAVHASLPADIFIASAAVADLRPAESSMQKIKKENLTMSLSLERTEDIVASVARSKREQDIVIGFAAETENVVPNAKLKLESKQLDLIVANEVFKNEKGFGEQTTTCVFIDRTGVVKTHENTTKSFVADSLWNYVEKILEKQGARRTDHT